MNIIDDKTNCDVRSVISRLEIGFNIKDRGSFFQFFLNVSANI